MLLGHDAACKCPCVPSGQLPWADHLTFGPLLQEPADRMARQCVKWNDDTRPPTNIVSAIVSLVHIGREIACSITVPKS
jgi:hypothetical protein